MNFVDIRLKGIGGDRFQAALNAASPLLNSVDPITRTSLEYLIRNHLSHLGSESDLNFTVQRRGNQWKIERLVDQKDDNTVFLAKQNVISSFSQISVQTDVQKFKCNQLAIKYALTLQSIQNSKTPQDQTKLQQIESKFSKNCILLQNQKTHFSISKSPSEL
eukprot:TRINITY_DN21504_c0_g1_i1.p1 TRINITY_DN21504_c0_g1~~TRINITY_DN21504_c0_g1_i1.p1  ORF type:complete len:162 (+),score=48.61 TRINITY_DN21504_c0_g1_i1:120-605(+)